jgi:hypothetical protein
MANSPDDLFKILVSKEFEERLQITTQAILDYYGTVERSPFAKFLLENSEEILRTVRSKAYVERIIRDSANEAISKESVSESTGKDISRWRRQFVSCLRRLKKDSEQDRKTMELVFGAIEAAFLLGGAIGETEDGAAILANFNKQRASHARQKRAQKPREVALQRAIKDALGGRVVPHPYKEAEAIRDPINEMLRKEGFKPATKKAIGDRLKKFRS